MKKVHQINIISIIQAISSLPAVGQEGEITVNPLDEPIPIPGISWEVKTFSPTDRPHSKFGK